MFKINMNKIASLCLAGSLVLAAHSFAKSDDIKTDITSTSSYEVISLDEVMQVLAMQELIRDESNDDVSLEYYDEDAPIVVESEKVLLNDGSFGYKFPVNYIPLLVDEDKPIPPFTKVLEKTEEYEILSGLDLYRSDGIPIHYGFEGTLGIYYPYYIAFDLYQNDRQEFYKRKLEAYNNYGELSFEYHIFLQAEGLSEKVHNIYNSERVLKLK